MLPTGSMSDTYRTILRTALAEPPKTKGSRFIGEAFPATTEAEAESRLEAVRKREHAATHWCWAWRLGIEGDVFRYNDDGEPSGSAGAPILRQIDARTLTNTVVVVTRALLRRDEARHRRPRPRLRRCCL